MVEFLKQKTLFCTVLRKSRNTLKYVCHSTACLVKHSKAVCKQNSKYSKPWNRKVCFIVCSNFLVLWFDKIVVKFFNTQDCFPLRDPAQTNWRVLTHPVIFAFSNLKSSFNLNLIYKNLFCYQLRSFKSIAAMSKTSSLGATCEIIEIRLVLSNRACPAVDKYCKLFIHWVSVECTGQHKLTRIFLLFLNESLGILVKPWVALKSSYF